jgi:hypothetical protein
LRREGSQDVEQLPMLRLGESSGLCAAKNVGRRPRASFTWMQTEREGTRESGTALDFILPIRYMTTIKTMECGYGTRSLGRCESKVCSLEHAGLIL